MINQKIILSLIVLTVFFIACENQIDNCINVECEENCECVNGECECEEDIFDRNTDSLALVALYESTYGLGPDLHWDLHSPMRVQIRCRMPAWRDLLPR